MKDPVDTILGWGDAEVEAKIEHINGQYHRGLRMNELSEVLVKRNLLQNENNRAIMTELCNSYSMMSLEQIDDFSAGMHGLCPKAVPTQAREIGSEKGCVWPARAASTSPRSIIVLLDRSSSMCSTDAR